MINLRISMSFKLAFIGLTFVAAAVGTTLFSANQYYDLALKDNMEDIKKAVSDGYNIISQFQQREREGLLTREQAQAEAIKIIRVLHRDDDDYVWVNTYAGVMIWHPNEGFIGKHLYDMTDPKGTYLFHRFAEIAKGSGSGFIKYYWTKPSKLEAYEKVSFVKGFEPWQWIIGSGLYIDSIEQDRNTYLAKTAIVVIVVSLILLLLLLTHWLFVARQIRTFVDSLKKLARGEPVIGVPSVHSGNEFSQMWKAVASVGDHFGAMERRYLDKEAEKISQRTAYDHALRKILVDCEGGVTTGWGAVRTALDDIKATSNTLGAEIEKTHAGAEQLASRQTTEVERASGSLSALDECRLLMETCSGEVAHLLERSAHVEGIARESLGFATKFRRAAEEDLEQALSILRNTGGQIRLIDMILNEIVLSGPETEEMREYQSVSSETKATIQRLTEAVDRLSDRRAGYLSMIPTFSELQASGIPTVGQEPLVAVKLAEKSVSDMASGMAAACESIRGTGILTRELANRSVRQNAELIKLVWRVCDVAQSMEKIVAQVEASMKAIHEQARKPV